MKRFCLFLVATLMLTLFSSCGTKPERVSAEKVAKLREEYPYHNELPANGSFEFRKEEPMRYFWERTYFEWIAVVEITGEMEMATVSVDLFSDPKANEAHGAQPLERKYLPVKITKFIAGNSELKKGTEIILSFAPIWPMELVDVYEVGQKYVVCMSKSSTQKNVPENCYDASTIRSFYLTKEQVVMPMTTYYDWITDCEGMYLNTFVRFVQEEYDQADKDMIQRIKAHNQ